MEDDQDDLEQQQYKVVVNDEDQYSIWPNDRDNPIGWHDEGYAGSRRECLARIDEVWRDMRPRSVRERKVDGPTDERRA